MERKDVYVTSIFSGLAVGIIASICSYLINNSTIKSQREMADAALELQKEHFEKQSKLQEKQFQQQLEFTREQNKINSDTAWRNMLNEFNQAKSLLQTELEASKELTLEIVKREYQNEKSILEIKSNEKRKASQEKLMVEIMSFLYEQIRLINTVKKELQLDTARRFRDTLIFQNLEGDIILKEMLSTKKLDLSSLDPIGFSEKGEMVRTKMQYIFTDELISDFLELTMAIGTGAMIFEFEDESTKTIIKYADIASRELRNGRKDKFDVLTENLIARINTISKKYSEGVISETNKYLFEDRAIDRNIGIKLIEFQKKVMKEIYG